MKQTAIMTTDNQPEKQSTDLKTSHYIDNKVFLEALIDHRKKVDYHIANNLPKPIVSNYLGECFIKIATHLSYKANFINYTYKDDMISDGIENCLTAVEKFDPSKSVNPFAYYTQIVYFAFVRRIQKEKKQQAAKYKLIENIDFNQIASLSEGDEEIVQQLLEIVQKQSDQIDPERKRVKGKPGRKKKVDVEVKVFDSWE